MERTTQQPGEQQSKPQGTQRQDAPQRRLWQAPKGQVLAVAEVTRSNSGGGGDFSGCAS